MKNLTWKDVCEGDEIKILAPKELNEVNGGILPAVIIAIGIIAIATPAYGKPSTPKPSPRKGR